MGSNADPTEAVPSAEEAAAELLELGTATLGECGARAMRARVSALWPGARLAAPVYTVRCTAGDNLAVHVAVARAPAGYALVVDVGDLRELGYWGEVLTVAAQARGLVGLVIDGGVRDVAAIEEHGFPVFASLRALRGATKDKPGAINVPIKCGGMSVVRGDWVVGDADGVVVVPGDEFYDVLDVARLRADREAKMLESLRSGRKTIKLLGLDASLVREGDTE